MSYQSYETQLVAEALEAIPDRLDVLERAMQKLPCWDPSAHFCIELEQELCYMERLIKSSSTTKQGRAKLKERADLTKRVETLRAAKQQLPLASLDEIPHHFDHGSSLPNSTAPALAKFIRPSVQAAGNPEQSFHPEDEVRLQAVEGRLPETLSQFTVLSVAGRETSVFMRGEQDELREWGPEDDAVVRQREELALLELGVAVANFTEVHQLLAAEVENQQPQLDEIEANVAATRQNVSDAVSHLGDGKRQQQKMVFAVLGFAIVGVGAVAVGGAVASGCLACVAVRGAMTFAAVGAKITAQKSLSYWQKSAINWMTENLPSAFDRLPQATVDFLRAAGNEAEQRLMRKLENENAWHTMLSPSAWAKGFTARYRGSETSGGASAWTTKFASDVPAWKVFQVVQRMTTGGSLDPGCEVVWSRPVDGAPGTFIRYTIFSAFFNQFARDFYCICRCHRVEDPDGLSEKYVLAVASLQPELLECCGLPDTNAGIDHGCIHICGVLVHDCDDGTSVIEVMADVDARIPGATVLPVMKDKQVRMHVLNTAANLRNALRELA